jgi:hypothetical protein
MVFCRDAAHRILFEDVDIHKELEETDALVKRLYAGVLP